MAVVLATFLAMAVTLSFSSAASAATTPPHLGTAEAYSVLGGQTVTNTGPSTLSGDLGVSPGDAITGFPPGLVGGTTHAGDAEALQAQSDLVVAYNDVAGRVPTASIAGDLGGQTLVDGVYNSTGSIGLTGTLTLDGQGDPNSVFIFQVASTLITATSSNVSLINGAQACNVYWQVGSSATLGTGSTFVGSILALTSISATTGATLQGRALARNGAVTLDSNTFTTSSCAAEPTTPPTETPTETRSAEDGQTESPAPTETPTESVAPTDDESPEASNSPAESDAPSGSDSPRGSDATSNAATSDDATDNRATSDDATDDDATESAVPSESDQSTREAGTSTEDSAEAPAEAASESSDLPATGPGTLTSALIGLSVLLILGGATLLILRRQRSHISE